MKMKILETNFEEFLNLQKQSGPYDFFIHTDYFI